MAAWEDSEDKIGDCKPRERDKEKMPRVNVYLSKATQEALGEYRQRVWGGHHSVSAIVQRALREFLEKENKRER